jgi:hypothetical protein
MQSCLPYILTQIVFRHSGFLLPPPPPLLLLLPLLQLSPDGKYLAYVRPSGPNDVYNVFIKALPGPGQVRAAGASTSLFEKEGVAKDKQVGKGLGCCLVLLVCLLNTAAAAVK